MSFNEDAYRDKQLNKYLKDCEDSEEVSNCCGVEVYDDTIICKKCKEHCDIISLGEWNEIQYENAMWDKADAYNDDNWERR